jgi:GAF domain-containing protein
MAERTHGRADAGSRRTEGALAGRLRRALNAAGASTELRRADHLRMLEAIVSTAARVIDATAGSLMLLDQETEELVFQVAVGPGSEEIKQLRVPLGQGIAGFTAATGQSLAIADTSQDARFARQIAEGSGYVPRNLLAVPLVLRGEVIGVMELLDKRGGRESFTPADAAVLSSFGEQAALAIEQSLHSQRLERLLARAAGDADGALQEEIGALVRGTLADPEHDRTLALAQRVAAIAAAGEREARLCAALLDAVIEYTSTDPSAGLLPPGGG